MPVWALYLGDEQTTYMTILLTAGLGRNVLGSTLQGSVTFQKGYASHLTIDFHHFYSPLLFSHTLFLIAAGIVLVLADNKGDKCIAYCKSLWLGLGHDTCQPMINWLCVCSISNAKLWRGRKRARERKEHDGEMGERESAREGGKCRHISGTESRMPQMLDVAVCCTDKA